MAAARRPGLGPHHGGLPHRSRHAHRDRRGGLHRGMVPGLRFPRGRPLATGRAADPRGRPQLIDRVCHERRGERDGGDKPGRGAGSGAGRPRLIDRVCHERRGERDGGDKPVRPRGLARVPRARRRPVVAADDRARSGGARRPRAARGDRHPGGLKRAGEGDLGQTAGSGHLIAADEDPVAAVDRGPVAPGGAGQVERAGAAVHHLAAAVRDPVAPASERPVEQLLQPRRGRVGALAGPDRHLRLHERLAARGERRIVGGIALDPPRAREVGNDPRIVAATSQREVEAERVAAGPVQLRVPEQLTGLAQLQGNDRRTVGQRGDALAGRDPHPERAGAPLHRVDHHAPAAHREPRGDLRVKQQSLGPLPHERRRQLSGIVMEGVDAGQPRQHCRGPLVGVIDDPGAEVLLDGRGAPAESQPRGDEAERGSAVDRALVVETHAGQLRAGHRRQQIALTQPRPQRAPLVDRVGTEVRLVGAGVAAGAPAERRACLTQLDRHALLRAADGRGEARDAASDNRDRVHARHRIPNLALSTVPVVSGRSGPVDLLLELRRGAGPLHEQLERALREAVREGRLQAGARLPSSRALAAELGISRGVATAAYEQLVAEGYLQTRQGAPVRVAEGVRAHAPRPPAPPLIERFAYDLTPGLPDLLGFPRERWLRSVRSAWREAPLDAVGYGDPRGEPALREVLADYLGRARGAAADPEHMVVCTGFRQGLSLTCRWLRETGIERVALEDPGWHAQRLIVEEAGLEVTPVAVDRDGVSVDDLEASGAEVVVTTPAHQFPTGVVLSPARRARLIEWAERGDRLIVEDDYDAELCRAQVGALQGLAPDRVLYIGSASKRLTPGMRLGWMLPPSWMSWALISAKAIEDAGSEVSGQLALADFLGRGELERHLRRMRGRYARRRETLISSLAHHHPSWRPRADRDGMFLLVDLPPDVDEAALLTAGARRGIGLEGLSLHSYTGAAPPGLVLGCGSLPEPAIDRALALLAGPPSAADRPGASPPSAADRPGASPPSAADRPGASPPSR